MKIDEIEIFRYVKSPTFSDEIEFKVICIKNCEEEGQMPWKLFSKHRKIKNGEIFTTNNFDFFWYPNVARLYSSDGDYLGLFDNSNFMKLEEYRNKIENLLD
jgi:hypothetical protein